MANCKEMLIYWIPSHFGVRQNENAARLCLGLTSQKFRIPYTDLRPKINKFFFTKWQEIWNNNIHNKLFQIKPSLGEWRPAFRKSRERVTISRLCIGQRRLTHSFIIFTNPSTQVGYDTRSIFKRSLTGLNSEFSFS